MTNALEGIEAILNEERRFREIAESIVTDTSALAAGFLPSMGQIHTVFEWVRDGMLAALKEWGWSAIPANPVCIVTERHVPPGESGFWAYGVEIDAIVLGTRAIACLASSADGTERPVSHFHPGLPKIIGAKANVVLMTMEECFHRRQCSEFGMMPEKGSTTDEDPMEIGWRNERGRLISEGKINIHPSR